MDQLNLRDRYMEMQRRERGFYKMPQSVKNEISDRKIKNRIDALHKADMWIMWAIVIIVMGLIVLLLGCLPVYAAENWKITSYCACVKCCGKTDAITASGKKAQYGMVACNWLPFGTKVKIEGLGTFVVADRGAKSLFGSKKNHIKHLDVYLPTHKQARNFGVRYASVEVIK